MLPKLGMARFVLALEMASVATAAAVAANGATWVDAALGVVLVGDEAPEVVPAAQGGGAGARPPMRWNNNSSRFILRRMAQIVSEGGRTNKCFKNKDVNCVAKLLREYSGEVVSPT